MKIVVLLTLTVYSFASFAQGSTWDRIKNLEFGQNQTWLYAGGHLGYSSLTTDKDNEAGEKSGLQYGAQASGLLKYDNYDLNVMASYYYVNFQSSRVDNVKFNLETQTLAIEASPLFNVLKKIGIGPKLHFILTDKLLVGPSERSNETDDDLTTRLVLGGNAFYNMEWKKYNLRFGAHYHKPISIGPRDANIFFLSLEIGQLFK